MRPIKTELQAFGPYAGYEKIDFEELSSKGLFLICGKTGRGKTMVLDAMTFALYGRSSGHGRDDFLSMRCTNADFKTTTFVRFEFENQGEYYRFERRLERKRTRLLPAYNVARRGEDGIWYPLMENARDKQVNDKAAEIIGLEYEQFRQVIVLPQGQFERLLTSSSEDKEQILTSIFGEERWQTIAENFYAGAERRKNELKGIQEKIRNSLTEEGCDSVLQLEQSVKQGKERKAALEEKFKKADHEKIIREQQGMLAIAKRFGDLHKAEKRVAEFEARQEERSDWMRTLEDAKRAEKVRALIKTAGAAEKTLTRRKEEEALARTAAAEKKKALETASEKVKLHGERERETESAKARSILYESRRGDYEGLEEAVRQLKAGERKAAEAAAEEKKARAASDAFGEEILRLQKEYSSIRSEHGELLNAYLAGITGVLAGQLEEGKPCPVCGSTEHPHKALRAENSVSKDMVDAKAKASERKYGELQDRIAAGERAKKLAEEKHALTEKVNTELTALSARLDSKKKNLVEGIDTAAKLEEELRRLQAFITKYEETKRRLLEAEKGAKDACLESVTRIGSAEKETQAAEAALKDAQKALEEGLKDNRFESREEAEGLMREGEEMEALSSKIAAFDAGLKAAKENLILLSEELKGRTEPDEKKCQELLLQARNAQGEYREKNALISREVERLQGKLNNIRKEGEGIEERIRQADEDFVFAKKLRGDSGTGLRRYVLGIMFSSVVAAANRMLELVHGGRYRLFRSDEKAQGTNKRGLELKVFDRNSMEHDGRFVSTLSGGEKFLVSLALSIGMSTVAQKSGIKIEALFIDEGFGSLDEDSINDAMNILKSIQEAHGLVGIISHVQLLQSQISVKLRVEADEKGSHIIQTIG